MLAGKAPLTFLLHRVFPGPNPGYVLKRQRYAGFQNLTIEQRVYHSIVDRYGFGVRYTSPVFDETVNKMFFKEHVLSYPSLRTVFVMNSVKSLNYMKTQGQMLRKWHHRMIIKKKWNVVHLPAATLAIKGLDKNLEPIQWIVTEVNKKEWKIIRERVTRNFIPEIYEGDLEKDSLPRVYVSTAYQTAKDRDTFFGISLLKREAEADTTVQPRNLSEPLARLKARSKSFKVRGNELLKKEEGMLKRRRKDELKQIAARLKLIGTEKLDVGQLAKKIEHHFKTCFVCARLGMKAHL